ncbi:MAG: hypothetical protein NDJ89_16085 [Oligoflexia bacterium]|nr:hypothetical protein [Oligoflexia bacterium]
MTKSTARKAIAIPSAFTQDQRIAMNDLWKKCSSCKKPIAFKALFWVCNVSTCNRKRTGLSFCSVSCWDAHLPIMNHREAWAEERRAPSAEEWQKILAGENEPAERRSRQKESAPPAPQPAPAAPSAPKTILRRRSE